jgi:hypothetical protein
MKRNAPTPQVVASDDLLAAARAKFGSTIRLVLSDGTLSDDHEVFWGFDFDGNVVKAVGKAFYGFDQTTKVIGYIGLNDGQVVSMQQFRFPKELLERDSLTVVLK